MTARKTVVVIALVALGSGAGLATVDSPADSAPVGSETVAQPFTAPTGPVMSSSAATEVAVAEAGHYGDPSPTELTQMQGSFAQTQDVLQPGSTTLDTPETHEWLRSETYLTVMHGHFTAHQVKPGTEAVEGTVMAVIADAHTGWTEGVYVGPTAPDSAQLTPVEAPPSTASAGQLER